MNPMKTLLPLACLILSGCGLNKDIMMARYRTYSTEDLISTRNTSALAQQRQWAQEELNRRRPQLEAQLDGSLDKLVRQGAIRRSMVSPIKKSKARIGMNKIEARLAWGAPNDINTTVSRYGQREQWCYGSVMTGGMSFLYFENGSLVTIQD